MEISQDTIANVLQAGGQYMLPTAALLRALYSGWKGKLPEGVSQILAASLFAGLTAITDNKQPDFTQVVLEVTGNTVFMAGLLTFIVVYLIRLPNFGLIVDTLVGGVLGGIGWVLWVSVLGNTELPWWTIPLGVVGGAVAFILLRFALRQIARVLRVAQFFVMIGIMFIVGAGGLYLLQQVTGVNPLVR